MAVTPVRTGPFPICSLPSPEIRVVWPTSTPFTSVIALLAPGVPSKGTPRSRARGLVWADEVMARVRVIRAAVRRSCGKNIRPPTNEEYKASKGGERSGLGALGANGPAVQSQRFRWLRERDYGRVEES